MRHYTRGTHPASLANLAAARKKYSLDEGFFRVVDYERGYYGGILAADGNIAQNRRTITWSVQARDRELLEQFNTACNSTYPLKTYSAHGFPQVVLSVTSETMVEDLSKIYNLAPAKSLTLQPPSHLSEGARDGYVKGYIDGDGSIGLRGNELSVSVVGTRTVLEFIRQEWVRVTDIEMPDPHKVGGKNLWCLSISNAKARAVYAYYYALPLGLSRKWTAEKYDICENWRWRSEKHRKNFELYRFVCEREGLMSVAEIARERGCTYQNISYVLKSPNYLHYKKFEFESKVLDEGIEVLS